MVGRRPHAAARVASAVLAVVAASTTSAWARADRPGPATVYQLRPDLRLCPSPLCGGIWASRMNRAVTPCLGGAARPACYVAAIGFSELDPGRRERVERALRSGRLLVAGVFTPYSADEFPGLARLVAHQAWLAAGSTPSTDTVYRVVDTGVRCITAPCFSLRATGVNGARVVTLSNLDLAGVGATTGAVARARAALTRGGLLVTGPVRAVPHAGPAGNGRELSATQFWLPA